MNVPGHNIRILREAAGLSLRALATAAEIDVAALSRLEAGKSSGRRSSLEKIARALSVSFDTLYAPIEMVEAAALRMRNVPILSHSQIRPWLGGTLEINDDQPFLHADLKRASRFAFALLVGDAANTPQLSRGDHALFDPKQVPSTGDFVASLDADGAVRIGRFRPLPASGGKILFEVVPMDPMRFPIASSASQAIVLVGKMIESRRYF